MSKNTLSRVQRRSLLLAVPGASLGLTPALSGCRTGKSQGRADGVVSAPPAEAPAHASPAEAAGPILGVFTLGAPPWETFDPFLFCVHHKDDYPEGNEAMGPVPSLAGRNMGSDFGGKDGWNMYHGQVVPGFPRHPHRGFETVTVTRRGHIDHSDSLGATARYGEGDVQWMTAGRGIVHAEMFPLIERGKSNPAELFQIWINLPAVDKFAEPHFSMFWDKSVPKQAHADAAGKKTEVTIVAGSLGGLTAPAPPPRSWASKATADVAIWSLQMEPGATFTLPRATAGANRTLYFFDGASLDVAGKSVAPGHGVRLRSDVAVLLANGAERGEVLLLQGQPIGEPVVKHGPFVMNSSEEIHQAISDYRRTQFGGWPWPDADPVHPRDEGRFAVHADGREERGT